METASMGATTTPHVNHILSALEYRLPTLLKALHAVSKMSLQLMLNGRSV